MEITAKQKLLLALGLALVHNILFWNELLGINVVIFSALLIAALGSLYTSSFKATHVRITLAGTILSGIFVVLYGSDVAKFSHYASLLLLIGFVHAPMLRSIVFAIGETAETLIKLPLGTKRKTDEKEEKNNYAPLLRKLRLSLIPLVALFFFYWIYKLANPVFDELSSNFWNTIGENIAKLFEDFSFARILFALLGLLLALITLFRPAVQSFLASELKLSDRLFRVKQQHKFHHFKTFSLVNEYQSALIMVGLINMLLVIVNIIDINWIWFNFDVKQVANLSQFVHEGTYLLIASILLSMAIIEYFFRKNLNFYSKNKGLKVLCYVWIVQNIIMVISVAMRNYHYIAQHGLAYKRIGVVFFLALTIAGLISQAYKINNTRSAYFMLRINSWAVYVVMLTIAAIDWDIVIARHNISHPTSENIDTHFLKELAPKTLPILLTNEALFDQDIIPLVTETDITPEVYKREEAFNKQLNYKQSIQYKAKVFMHNYEKRNWLEWNYADAMAYEALKSNESLKK